MIKWYLSVKKIIRSLDQQARDALDLYNKGGKEASSAINGYMSKDYEHLCDIWNQKYPEEDLRNLGRHIHFGMDNDYEDITKRDLPELEMRADDHLQNNIKSPEKVGFEELLHPIILEHSFQLYRNGHFREAVLNSITAIFDFIRLKTKCNEDGDRLINEVMSPNKPKLILSEIETESGQNDQKGFMQIFRGTYQGIRNPKAHSLTHDLTPQKTAQYLIFASLLARRIEESLVVKNG